MKNLYSILLLVLMLTSCSTRYRVGTVSNNVCKTLKEKVVIVPVFVESEYTHVWSEYDIQSTLDSIDRAKTWIVNQAFKRNKTLSIEVAYLKMDSITPVKEEFQFKTLSGTLFKYINLSKGIKMVDNWADASAKKYAKRLPPETSKEILSNNKLNDSERLIARMKDLYGTDNIVLMYFINNYYENEISVVLHSGDTMHVEYGVVSAKSSSVIAHEFLHVFGALDMYITPFDRRIIHRMKKRKAMRQFPQEIMAFTYRDLQKLEISPLTEYLIGWSPTLDKKLAKRFLWRRFRPVDY
ncbi:MAG: hypothetical protein IT221_15280 [Fluviicola sp.]|nr:hypothetical protein [Fluviicola sp.]